MVVVVIIAIVILSVVLYKMLGQSEKTYTYTRTVTITYKPDGTEQLQRLEESGIIFLSGKKLTIDGEDYVFKSSDRKKIQAKLNYEGSALKSVTLNLPDGGEKFFYVDKTNRVKEIQQR